MFNVAILGSTGSIGTQTLQVLENLSEYRVYGLSTNKNVNLLSEQIQAFHPKMVVIGDEDEAARFRRESPNVLTASGNDGLCELAADANVDIIVNALVGFAGLEPTLAALEAGKKVALANKEVLVAAGHLVMKHRSQIVPIDSEHSAIWQILAGKRRDDVASIILTASGGPFHQEPGNLQEVTVEQALKHPNWSMGGKITIDSATLMNKGLEVIEAHWLFDLKYDQIEVVIHPQSIIHSMVRFKDGSVLAQMAPADMRLPIQYALTYPDMQHAVSLPLDLLSLKPLTFAQHDPLRFPCLNLAYHAGKVGGSMPTVLNAANEVAVDLFLEKKIGFTDIPKIITSVVNKHRPTKQPTLDQLFSVDNQARETALYEASQLIGRKD